MAHSVLLAPVPAVESLVLPRVAREYRRQDGGTHAHVTVLGPFLPPPQVLEQQQELSALLQETDPFDLMLTQVGTFGGGIVHLRPAGEQDLRHLLSLVQQRYPNLLPYGGAFPSVEFHVTVATVADDTEREEVIALAERALPVTAAVDHLEVVWYEPGATRALAAFPLGQTGSLTRH